MSYRLIRRLLFRFNPETAHELTLDLLATAARLKLTPLFVKSRVHQPVTVMGIQFPNAVGLAAGLDKNGECIDGLAALGFGFVEIGTVTPRPQPGNPSPRLFRIPEAEGIINRMGFNNLGVDHLLEQVKAASCKSLIGINIGKNFDTPVEKAVEDYLIGFNKVYPYADYVTINISSPNTPGLRSLQFGESLDALLSALKAAQGKLAEAHGRYVPMAVKVAPDLTEEEVRQLAEAFSSHQVDAVIATNTTMSRDAVKGLPHAEEAGGLSGAPVFEKSTEIVRQFRAALPENLPIIAAGGIMSGEDAMKKLEAGAALVQLYSGLIYRGPSLVREVVEIIAKRS